MGRLKAAAIVGILLTNLQASAEERKYTWAEWKTGWPQRFETRVVLSGTEPPIYVRHGVGGIALARKVVGGTRYKGAVFFLCGADEDSALADLAPLSTLEMDDPVFDREQIRATHRSHRLPHNGNNANQGGVLSIANCSCHESFPMNPRVKARWREQGELIEVELRNVWVFCCECDVRDQQGNHERKQVLVTCAYNENQEIKTPEQAFAAEPHTIDFPKIIAEYHQKRAEAE